MLHVLRLRDFLLQTVDFRILLLNCLVENSDLVLKELEVFVRVLRLLLKFHVERLQVVAKNLEK
jgi:hypothetical protein